jgi:hypothetical protein
MSHSSGQRQDATERRIIMIRMSHKKKGMGLTTTSSQSQHNTIAQQSLSRMVPYEHVPRSASFLQTRNEDGQHGLRALLGNYTLGTGGRAQNTDILLVHQRPTPMHKKHINEENRTRYSALLEESILGSSR